MQPGSWQLARATQRGSPLSTIDREKGLAVPRDKIILECTDCKNRNFFLDKNKRKHPERVEMRKYCPHCNKHVGHKESK